MIKPGDRCIIIHSLAGDEGAIVIVTDYFSGGYWEGLVWQDCYNVIIESLGSPLHSVNGISERILTHTIRPYYDKWLRKLPEVDDEEEDIEKNLVPLFYPDEETVE